MSCCRRARRLARDIVMTERAAMESLKTGGSKRTNRTLESPYRAVSISIPESMALMGLGASGWASGSQVWRGTIADFTPKPITIRTKTM